MTSTEQATTRNVKRATAEKPKLLLGTHTHTHHNTTCDLMGFGKDFARMRPRRKFIANFNMSTLTVGNEFLLLLP